jgi:histidine phosphotransfer protein HptB
MAYDPGAIEAALAAAVGDDPGLIAELRLAFTDSAERALDALAAAVDDAAWVIAARRLKGLAASFGAERLMVQAAAAEDRPLDGEVLRKLRLSVSRL